MIIDTLTNEEIKQIINTDNGKEVVKITDAVTGKILFEKEEESSSE